MSFLLVQLKCPYSHQQYINVILISTTRMSLFTSTIYKCHSYSTTKMSLFTSTMSSTTRMSHQQYINVILISTTKMSLFTSTIYKCHSY